MSETSAVGRTTARAAIWALVSMAGAKLITLIGLMLLARLLAPREFGLLAFAMTYIVYAETIGDLGSGVALIYWPDRRHDASQVTFIISMAAGAFWCGLTLLIAPAVAAYFEAPNGASIVRALAICFLIKFAGNTHNALAQKDLRFGARTIPEIGLAVVKAGISLIFAWLGFGAWSLVWGHIAGLAVWTIFLWLVVPWRPDLSWPSDLFKPMLAFGRGIIFVNVLTAVVLHADLAIVGGVLGLTALGLYQLATKIPDATILIVLRALSAVLFPTFSKLAALGERAGESLREAFLVACRYIAAITLPLVIGLFVLAEPMVMVFFGDQWMGAVPIVRALALLTGVQALANHAGDVLKGTGRATLIVKLDILRAVLALPALYLGAQVSAATAAASLAAADGFAVIVGFVITMRVIGVSMGPVLRAFAPAAQSVAVMGIAVAAWVQWGPRGPALVQMLGGVLIGAVVYLVALHLSDPGMLRSAKENFLSRREAAAQ